MKLPNYEQRQRWAMRTALAVGFFVILAQAPGVQKVAAQGFSFVNALLQGHILSGSAGTVPTVTNGTLSQGSTDAVGQVTSNGTGSPVLTFGTAYAVAPNCAFQIGAELETIAPTVTATNITLTNVAQGEKVSYICLGTSAN